MSKAPFMPLWVADFLADTMDLDAAEVGAYLLLLMAQWSRDGKSLPNDSEKLRRIARCNRNWAKVWSALEGYFCTDENGIYSKRLRLESQNVTSKRLVNSQNGALGGRPKSLKDIEPNKANGYVPPKRNESIPEPYIEEEKEEPKGSPKKTNLGSRILAEWKLPKDWGEWAVSEGMDDLSVRKQADRFRDYWLGISGKAGVKLDWQATWRNWVRRSLESQGIKFGQNMAAEIGTRKTVAGGKTLEYAGLNQGWMEVHE